MTEATSSADTRLRPDYRAQQAIFGDERCPERLIAHYELERRLADRLRCAGSSERRHLYGELYEELFSSIEDHPQHTAASDGESLRVSRQVRAIAPYLKSASTFVEIGCGDAALSNAVAGKVTTAFGVDVTDALLPADLPENFRFVRTDGILLALPSASVDLVYSNQLMEHLHPDDARDQLKEVHRILKPSGRYFCITPSRVTGPHDISRYFDYVATGFHILEYDYSSIRKLFMSAGFRRFQVVLSARGHQLTIPYAMARLAEILVYALPVSFRTRFSRTRWADVLFAMTVIATR